MSECGVDKPLNDWFRDYLTGRSYRVRVGDALSAMTAVRCGVPQVSGCGPVSYLMHVNSLCGALQHCTAHMFADDLCMLLAGADLAELLSLVQCDVDAVVKWSLDNGILLNASKTKYMIIHSPYIDLSKQPSALPITAHSYSCIHNKNIYCTCEPIDRVNYITYLGVIVDDRFSWTQHVNYICNLKKAFDTVSIPILVHKLEKIGIRGTQLSIFKDYLAG
ncbi:uncharacterized protein LOC132904086 [Amyelois transitella]|uniref:uncharacterized protein LOC132904086 n=1 Tax=Amyelois transitella TaxID=680683 RepID=UPI00298F80DC|nr:uncharacterized protein LOC132904086 [Amyelois transitella]